MQWVFLPSAAPRTKSSLPRLVRQIREWTGWSQRDLASILGTSHTTVRKLESEGRVTARSRDAATRVAPTHDLIRRLIVVAHHDSGRLATALNAQSHLKGKRVVDLITSGDYPSAYVAAARALRGTRTGMLAPAGNRAIRNATMELP
ncbi:helix-turn-helix domain-containing protein [Actinoplanes flavus]